MSKLKLTHLIVGGFTVITFLLTGLYMRKNFPELYGDNQAMRMMFRSSHIYILLIGLLNVVFGSYLTLSLENWKRILQVIGSALILAATGMLIYAFFHEPFLSGIHRPVTFKAVIMLLTGTLGHFVGSLPTKDS
jgi:hypothetical protein